VISLFKYNMDIIIIVYSIIYCVKIYTIMIIIIIVVVYIVLII
jgi:hypothetical protein